MPHRLVVGILPERTFKAAAVPQGCLSQHCPCGWGVGGAWLSSSWGGGGGKRGIQGVGYLQGFSNAALRTPGVR